MAVERTLSIIKPDATRRNLTGAIVDRFEKAGLRVIASRRIRLSTAQAEAFYGVHAERPFFRSLVDFMTSGPVVVQALEGENAIAKNREVMGATNPANAAEGTIRKDFAESIEANSVHGSDAPETAANEIRFFFSDLEIVGLSKTVVITGGTSGIGEVAAVELAGQGARIVLIARDPIRANATLMKLPGDWHKAYIADLSRLCEMKRVSEALAAEEPEIDVLINNAGALFSRREVTEDGLERTFATNHMAYFVVTNMLLPKMKAGSRIVSTASDAHRGNKLDFSDLQSAKRYSGFSVYGKSKLANILFNRELARRLDGTGIAANCLHPGFVATRFGDASGGLIQTAVKVAKPLGAISPEEGARTIVHLASSPEVEGKSGGYYFKNRLAEPTKEAQSDADAARLWDVSAGIAHVG